MAGRRLDRRASSYLSRVAALAFFALVVVALAASRAPAAPAAPLDAARYVAFALAWDKLDVSEAHLAIARGDNDRVKAFARLAARDHTRSAAMLRAAVRSAINHDPAPPTLDQAQTRMLSVLRGTPMRRLDDLYLAHQAQAQADALALHRAYASQGAVPELRQVAQLLAPVVQQHLDALHDLQQRRPPRSR